MANNENIHAGLRHTQRRLLATACILLGATAATVALCESTLVVPGACAADTTLQYAALMVMELLTICTIPAALKMFSMKSIKKRLADGGHKALARWGTLRILLIGLPMLANTIMYYAFMAVAFAYMALIGVLCFSFVFPTKTRCIDDIQTQEQ